VYVPLATRISSPSDAASRAAWIVGYCDGTYRMEPRECRAVRSDCGGLPESPEAAARSGRAKAAAASAAQQIDIKL